jgi:hypothetical protein
MSAWITVFNRTDNPVPTDNDGHQVGAYEWGPAPQGEVVQALLEAGVLIELVAGELPASVSPEARQAMETTSDFNSGAEAAQVEATAAAVEEPRGSMRSPSWASVPSESVQDEASRRKD